MPSSPTRTARAIASACVAFRTRRLDRVVTRIYDEALRPHGLRSTQLNLLTAITLTDGGSPAELSQLLELEKSSLSRNLAILEEREWVRLERDPSGRTQAVHITGAGRDKLEEIRPAWNAAQAVTRTTLGDALFDTLAELD